MRTVRLAEADISHPAGDVSGVVACPAFAVCAEVGTVRPTCRYSRAALPPVGMSVYNPEEAWCPPGVATLVLLLAGRRV